MASLLKNKNGFIFSFLAIFIVFLIFSFGSLYLFKGSFTKADQFKDSRLNYVNNEINYFQGVYLKNALEFSFYNTIYSILQNKSNLEYIQNNYSRLNSLVFEGMENGTLRGIPQKFLVNKTMNYFISNFDSTFQKNYMGNFSFKILKINMYQKDPYKLSLQVLADFNISTLDQMGTWNFQKYVFVSVPVYGLKDPQFFDLAGFNITIKSVDLYASNINWSVAMLNETLNENYSTVYTQPEYKYTLGNNFIAEMLNVSRSSYLDVLGFYSFDYDSEFNRVYDTSQNSNFIKDYGNTRLLMSFDNGTVSGNRVSDLSAYNNSGTIYGSVDCNAQGVYGNSCSFDGNGYINISNSSSINFNNSDFSISLWINPKNITSNQGLVSKRGTGSPGLDKGWYLRLSGNDLMVILDDGTSNSNQFVVGNVTKNTWQQVSIVVDRSKGLLSFYLNGALINQSNISKIGSLQNSWPLVLGEVSNGMYKFNGSIDELGIYSKALSKNEVLDLYNSKKAEFIDYKDSLFGKALEFDGIDDYVDLDNSTGLNPIFNNQINVRSGGFWVEPYNITKPQMIYKEGGGTNGINVYLNNSRVYYGAYSNSNGWSGSWISSPIKADVWTYVTYVFDNATNSMKLYVDGNLVNSSSVGAPIAPHNAKDSIGAMINDAILNGKVYSGNGFYFNGSIDEVKFYSRALSSEEIYQNYHDYAGFSKGCCNYMNLINPNSMGYNSSYYDKNISYSSKLFFDFYKRGGISNPSRYNLTLLNVTNITSKTRSKNFYHFLADDCMIQAYSIGSYSPNSFDFYKKNGAYNLSCSNLVKAGLY